MKGILQFVILSLLLCFSGSYNLYSQSATVKADSVVVQGPGPKDNASAENKKTTEKNKPNEKTGAAITQNQVNNRRQGMPSAVKQVRGARPDMSKARGARPPSIIRSSGSGVPRGMGKPGGAPGRSGR